MIYIYTVNTHFYRVLEDIRTCPQDNIKWRIGGKIYKVFLYHKCTQNNNQDFKNIRSTKTLSNNSPWVTKGINTKDQKERKKRQSS